MEPSTTANLFVGEAAVPFERAWRWQRGLQARLLADPRAPEALVLLQHEPCYTLGRGASLEHLTSIRPLRPSPCTASTAAARSPITPPASWFFIRCSICAAVDPTCTSICAALSRW